jgi:hypothetical protein
MGRVHMSESADCATNSIFGGSVSACSFPVRAFLGQKIRQRPVFPRQQCAQALLLRENSRRIPQAPFIHTTTGPSASAQNSESVRHQSINAAQLPVSSKGDTLFRMHTGSPATGWPTPGPGSCADSSRAAGVPPGSFTRSIPRLKASFLPRVFRRFVCASRERRSVRKDICDAIAVYDLHTDFVSRSRLKNLFYKA